MSAAAPATRADAKPVVVVGAGIVGLSAAIRLAAAGRRVVVVEQLSLIHISEPTRPY